MFGGSVPEKTLIPPVDMSMRRTNELSKKRKKDAVEIPVEDDLPAVVSLDIESDEEDRQGSDDGEMDDFPEIDMGDSEVSSDSEESEVSTEETKNPQNPGDLVVSSITGRLKRVYPDIEPDYDSDSSTEEVRVLFLKQEYIEQNASRHRIGLAMFLHIGTMIYLTLVTT